MARDGLLPRRLAKVSRRGVPAVVTVFTAIVVAILAGLLPLDELASLANAGTLAAFCSVGVCLIVLRIREPERKRVFKVPLWPLVGAISVIGCLDLLPEPEAGDADRIRGLEPDRRGDLSAVVVQEFASGQGRGDGGLMALRDLTGAVDFAVLDAMTGGDAAIDEEVLGLFVDQAALWSSLLDPRSEGWRDGVHTIRGAAAGIGARDLAAVCAEAEAVDQTLAAPALERVRDAMQGGPGRCGGLSPRADAARAEGLGVEIAVHPEKRCKVQKSAISAGAARRCQRPADSIGRLDRALCRLTLLRSRALFSGWIFRADRMAGARRRPIL